MSFGSRTNNYADLLSLKILLGFAKNKNCQAIKVFGYSTLVINWIKGEQRCRNTNLESLLPEFSHIISSFDEFSCMHIYREKNSGAD